MIDEKKLLKYLKGNLIPSGPDELQEYENGRYDLATEIIDDFKLEE